MEIGRIWIGILLNYRRIRGGHRLLVFHCDLGCPCCLHGFSHSVSSFRLANLKLGREP